MGLKLRICFRKKKIQVEHLVSFNLLILDEGSVDGIHEANSRWQCYPMTLSLLSPFCREMLHMHTSPTCWSTQTSDRLTCSLSHHTECWFSRLTGCRVAVWCLDERQRCSDCMQAGGSTDIHDQAAKSGFSISPCRHRAPSLAECMSSSYLKHSNLSSQRLSN